MPHSYTTRFRVRHSELDAHEQMPNRALAHLLQETSMGASYHEGYELAWYNEQHTVWVIREMTLEHLRPIRYLDDLEITTWLFAMQRVRARREYQARNTATGEVVARASSSWAYIDRQTMFPTRILPDAIRIFEPNGIRAVPRGAPRAYSPPPGGVREMTASRRVQHYETDPMQHVNNAIYLDWFEEPLAEMTPPSLRLCVRRHDVEFVRGALPGDEINLVTRLVGAGHVATLWEQEVTRQGERIARNHCTAFWVDGQGRPVRWSEMQVSALAFFSGSL